MMLQSTDLIREICVIRGIQTQDQGINAKNFTYPTVQRYLHFENDMYI